MSTIRYNQMGYTPKGFKHFIYAGDDKQFQVYRTDQEIVVLEGSLIGHRLDEASGDFVCKGDFTALTEAGEYYIKVGNDKSHPFIISNKQPVICMDALLKAFYFQRCGVELPKQYAGEWGHKACHLQPSYVFCQEGEEWLANSPDSMVKLDTAGGWHDAGDYGRYTIATVKTVADLLLAYDHCEEVFDHEVNIPESLKEGPDLLHEVKIGLDFLLKLQKSSDGSVYTKVATRYFPGDIPPEEDRKPLFVFDTSSPATAGFAAVMAMAARAYKRLDASYADHCLKAAKKAYDWLEINPQPKLFKNPHNISSGEYGDSSDLDERYWAAAELYHTTGEEKYHQAFLSYYELLMDRLSLGWRNVGGYGTIAYLFSNRMLKPEVSKALKEDWLTHAKLLVKRSEEDGYGISLSLKEYIWGSTMLLNNQCMQMIIAERLTGDTTYYNYIQSIWDYLFGKNPMDLSYVTGLGNHYVMHPHHRPSETDGVEEPVPGLVSGGPNMGLQDEFSKTLLAGSPPAKCFVDHYESYSTNEIDIYWNSPAVYVGAYLGHRV